MEKELWKAAIEQHRNLGGRPRKWKSPDELIDKLEEYCKACAENPILVQDGMRKSKDGGQKDEQVLQMNRVARPMTIDGYCNFAGIGDWRRMKQFYSNDEGFADAIALVERVIRDQQVSGAMVGLYRENIVARLNGITDRQDITSEGKRIEIQIVRSGNTGK